MSKKNLNAQEMAASATASKDVDVLDYLTKMIQTVPVDLKRQLTNEQIVDIVKNHLDVDANAVFLILNHNIYAVCSDGLVAIKSKYIVRGNFNRKDIQKIIGQKRTENTNKKIKMYYNFSKTVKENQKILAENGVFLSESRLYKFLKDMGEKPSKKKTIAGYNPKLSIRENMKALNCTLYQVVKMKKEYEKMCK